MTKTELITKLSNIEDVPSLAAEIADAADDDAVPEILNRYNLELTAEDVRILINDEEELDEDSLDDVTGGCKCKGLLKRAFTNLLDWLANKVGSSFSCPDCGE